MICYCIEGFIILQPRSRENTTYGVHEWGQKWNIFGFLYATACKKMALPFFFFFFFMIWIFFLIHQNLYLLIRGLFFIILLFFLTIPLQNSKLNTVLNIYM